MRIIISAGHGKYISGAVGYIRENEEAWKVTQRVAEILNADGTEATPFQDTTSHDQNTNLHTIVDFHNAHTRDLDVSVHFNSNGNTAGPLGSEVLYVSSAGQEAAIPVVHALASVGFINRGAKKRTDLFFLNNTEEPAILIETCFVTSQADVNLYHQKFEEVCQAIAASLIGDTEDAGEELSDDEVAVTEVARDSAIANYSWRDRGQAPIGYVEGFALSYYQCLKRWTVNDPIVVEMAKANTHDDSVDALSWYNSNFAALGMSNEKAGVDTLRHLFVLLMGLGMRESSGRHCEGRDMSASNVTSDTAEAGLYQTSYNASASCPEFDQIMDEYLAEDHMSYLETFKQDVSCDSSSWASYGSGRGKSFQDLCKIAPAFAVESCALVLRNLRQHYGPINRKEAELRKEADDMLKDVEVIVFEEDGPPPITEIPEVEITIRTKGNVKVTIIEDEE